MSFFLAEATDVILPASGLEKQENDSENGHRDLPGLDDILMISSSRSEPSHRGCVSRAVVGIDLATLFSDFSHEMATAVLPLYLASVGLGPAALGMMEGVADFLVSMSKLAGGAVGHHVHPWFGPRRVRTLIQVCTQAIHSSNQAEFERLSACASTRTPSSNQS